MFFIQWDELCVARGLSIHRTVDHVVTAGVCKQKASFLELKGRAKIWPSVWYASGITTSKFPDNIDISVFSRTLFVLSLQHRAATAVFFFYLCFLLALFRLDLVKDVSITYSYIRSNNVNDTTKGTMSTKPIQQPVYTAYLNLHLPCL